MTKQFKIGENAVGGIIKVVVNKDNVVIDALDYVSKKPVPFCREQFNKQEQWDMYICLTGLTTEYYANKILTHILNSK
jgi:hypothetical protein